MRCHDFDGLLLFPGMGTGGSSEVSGRDGGRHLPGTLSRYDGWGLFLILLVLLVVVGWIKRQHWAQIEGTLLIFGSLGSLGIALWILWDGVILGDPLYWHNYLLGGVAETHFYTYYNLW